MQMYVIEREMPGVGGMTPDELRGAAARSKDALAKLAPDVQWIQSFVCADKTYCIYVAKDGAGVRQHAELSGFPADRVLEVASRIDPTTAG